MFWGKISTACLKMAAKGRLSIFDKPAHHRFLMIFISFLIIWYGGSNRRCRVYQRELWSARLAGGQRQFRFYWEYTAIAVRRMENNSPGPEGEKQDAAATGKKRRRQETTIEEEKESDTMVRCSKDGERKEQERGTGWEMDCGGWGMEGREAVREKRRDGRDIATKSESRDEATTRWHDEKREERVLSFSFTFLHEPQFKREFNLCKFIMREHFAVYPVKTGGRDSSSRSLGADRRDPGSIFFVFRETKKRTRRRRRRARVTRWKAVDTCRGMVPSLKCPLHYHEDAADRFRHAWPRRRDVGNVDSAAFVPFLGPFPLISALSRGKKGCNATGCCAHARYGASLWDLLRWLIHAVLDLISRPNSLVTIN